MKRYVTAGDMEKLAGKKGHIIATSSNNVCMVKTEEIYTVWMPEAGFHICNTYCENEAWEAFRKYSK